MVVFKDRRPVRFVVPQLVQVSLAVVNVLIRRYFSRSRSRLRLYPHHTVQLVVYVPRSVSVSVRYRAQPPVRVVRVLRQLYPAYSRPCRTSPRVVLKAVLRFASPDPAQLPVSVIRILHRRQLRRAYTTKPQHLRRVSVCIVRFVPFCVRHARVLPRAFIKTVADAFPLGVRYLDYVSRLLLVLRAAPYVCAAVAYPALRYLPVRVVRVARYHALSARRR